MKPLGLLEFTLSVSFQVDLRENALQSEGSAKFRGRSEIASCVGVNSWLTADVVSEEAGGQSLYDQSLKQ